METPCEKYEKQKRNAKLRGISFPMTFEQWWKIWQDSGHWEQRGRIRGCYVMARFGDNGAYSTNNVKIIKHETNAFEGQIGRKHTLETRMKVGLSQLGRKRSLETRQKMRASALGKLKSAEHRKNISLSKKGIRLTLEHRAKISEGGLGKKRSAETKARISKATFS